MSDEDKGNGIYQPITKESVAKQKQANSKTSKIPKTMNIKLEQLLPFKGHPFKLYAGNCQLTLYVE